MHDLSRRAFLASVGAAGLAAALPARESVPAKFKLGLVTYNVAAAWDLATTLRICKAVGIEGVECRTTHKHGVEPTLTAEQRKDVKKQFADAGVVYWGAGSVCEFHSEDPAKVKKHIEDCKQFVKLVADMGGKGVKVRPNGVGKGMTEDQACEQIGKSLIECGKAAADVGVEIWVEVHGNPSSKPVLMKKMMDACGLSNVGVTWNSNPTDIANGSISEGFALLAKHIKSCHINDLNNDKSGKYPYRDLFKRLAGIGYDRYTLCEVGKVYNDPAEGEAFLKEYKAMWTELVRG